jgi:hypothetical protein
MPYIILFSIILGGRVVPHAFRGTYRDHLFPSNLAFDSNFWSRYGLRPTRPTECLRPRHGSAKRCFAAFELPGEDAECDAFVVQFFQADVTAEIFHVDAIVWE